MLENIYTTKMSADKKSLQKRFSKIRSKSWRISRLMAIFMSVAVLITVTCATIVMAAVGTDGLEYWDKNEVYILGSMKLSVDVDIEKAPQWIKDISSNGKLTLMINKIDTRATSGLVTHSNSAKISGDIGSEILTRSGTSSYYNTDVVKSGKEYDWAVMLFSYDTTAKGDIDTNNIYAYFTTNYDELSRYIGVDYDVFKKEIGFEKFSKGYDIEFIGDYEEAERTYNNGIYINYFTYFENKYNNRNVENVDINIIKADNNYITVKPKIDIEKASKLQLYICEPDQIYRSGTIKPYNLSEVNGKEIKIANMHLSKKYDSGKTYAVLSVITDDYDNVLYRQQDYITIP